MIFNNNFNNVNAGNIKEYLKVGIIRNFIFGQNDIVNHDQEYSHRLQTKQLNDKKYKATAAANV